jgi:sulfur transfer protein SufE
MTERQILRKVERIIELLSQKNIKEAFKMLLELKTKLEMEMKEEEEDKEKGRRVRHLMGWYLRLWNNRPPESFRFTDYKYIIGKHLRELAEIYERNGEDIETLKRDYEAFKNSRKGYNGILQFRQQLPNLKNANEWSSSENQRGKDFYLRGWEADQEKPFSSEDDKFSW